MPFERAFPARGIPAGGAKRLPPLAELSGPLQVFGRQVYSDLVDVVVRVFEVVRWRYAVSGPVRPYHAHEMEWSEDGGTWHPVPKDITLRLVATPQGKLRDGAGAELEELLARGAHEPLGHLLLREARAAAAADSPSSALVTALAALEVGAKHLIADLVPQAGWLAVQAPTPPIVTMLAEYLPTLPARLLANGKPITPPAGLLTTLRKAVTARNTVVHAGSRDLSREFVDRVLMAVSDMLWIFDFYAGHAWAIDHLTHETRTVLTADNLS